MATDKLGGNALVGLFAVAVAHALVVGVKISAGHISGGHLNPAVTLGLLFGGHITVLRSILYWIDQLLASSAACILLKYLTGGLIWLTNYEQAFPYNKFCILLITRIVSLFNSFFYRAEYSNSFIGEWSGLPSRCCMGDILTFSLLFTVYATIVDPNKGSTDGLGPMLTGFVVGANILAGGAFSGASMNPARSF
ncbi:hypothetical protein CRYUN_Cryun02cG0048900 [Craigia yunnanensis]